jgi:septal ring factor EnvC (AmiA/AmiB activator)
VRRDLVAGIAVLIAATGAATSARAAPAPDAGPRAALVQQLDDETATVDRALATVADKLTFADDTRRKRLHAAYRQLRSSPGDDAMAVARRRAAARLLLDRDRSERVLLADEAVQLRTARFRIASDAAKLPGLAFPVELARPVAGKVVRKFGALVHERSKATLSRRGLDFEVADRSPVTAPAAGTVRYAGPIRGLDQGVILDHGTYVTVLAKLGERSARGGAPIAAGDRVGTAARHRVYLEVRIKLGPGGLPIDPEPLLR